jgi:hypothetical protein
MKYTVEMGSGAMTCNIPSLTGSGIQRLMGGYIEAQPAQ